MKALSLLSFTAAALLAVPAIAADAGADAARQYHESAVANVRARLATLTAAAAKARQGGAKVMGSHTNSGTPLVNEFRAYPPSCAAWPLPDKASGATVSRRMALYTRDMSGNVVTPETVTITLWRVPCSSSGASNLPYNNDGGGNAMTLLRIDRDAANEARTDRFPTFPLLNIQQGGIGFNDAASAVRAATEPNTFVADGPYDAPVFVSTTYVLENYYMVRSSGALDLDYAHYYSYAFSLAIDPFISGSGATVLTIGDYTGSGLAALPLDGYLAAQYFNPALSEGVIVQVAEGYDGAHPARRQVIIDLLTLDTNGNPFWIVGSAAFDPTGATSLTIPLAYLINGNATRDWGSAQLRLLSCNKLSMTFTPRSGLPLPVPVFSGNTLYDRIFTANGMMCE